jgi:hypothetical protein
MSHRIRIGHSVAMAGLCVVVAALGTATHASPLNVDTGKILALNPGDTGTVTLSLTNENSGSPITTFNSWGFGLQLIPNIGATGTATLVSGSLPAVNPALADPEDPPLFSTGQTLNVAANGTTDYTLISSANQSALETTFALGQTYNIMDVDISLSPGATGSWSLYAVNDALGFGVWLNSLGSPTNFGNLPSVNGDGGTVLIGTVSAVPEPSGILLAASALAACGWSRWRSRRATRVPGNTQCSTRSSTRLLTAGLAVAMLLALSPSAFATPLYLSSLTAPPLSTGNLTGQDGWVAHSGAGSVPIQVGATGTTLAQGAGSREDANVSFTAIGAGQTYYFGFDVVVNGGDTNVYFAHFKDAASDFTVRTFVTPFGGSDFTFGLSAAGTAPDETWATGLDFGTTYRVVGAYDADSRLNRLWVNPTLETDTSISFTDPSANLVSSFALRQATGDSTQLISNLAVGTSFGDVVAVPEPSTLALAGIGAVGLVMYRLRRKN